jgi:hypothetical protein
VLGAVITAAVLRIAGLNDDKESNATTPVSASVSAKAAAGRNALQVASLSMPRNIYDQDWWAASGHIEVSAQQSAQLYQTKIDQQDPTAYIKWMRDHDAVDGEILNIEVTLEGKHPDGVRILDMRPVTKCAKPLAGTAFFAPSAGESDVVGLMVNLDDSYPRARVIESDGSPGGDYFKVKKYDLKEKEKVTLNIFSTTHKHYCEFRLLFDLIAGDERVTQIVDNKGQPFRVTGLFLNGNNELIKAAYKTTYDGGVALNPPQKVAWKRANP